MNNSIAKKESSFLLVMFLDVNQFSIITELLGTPPDDVIKTIGSENVRMMNKTINAVVEQVGQGTQ